MKHVIAKGHKIAPGAQGLDSAGGKHVAPPQASPRSFWGRLLEILMQRCLFCSELFSRFKDKCPRCKTQVKKEGK